MKLLADWIMKSFAKRNSSDWALAMQREFEELSTGHLSWAIGCKFVELKLNFPSNMRLMLAIAAVHFLAPVLTALITAPIFQSGGITLSQIVAFSYAAPWAFLLGIYRPRKVILISLVGGFLFPIASGYSVASAVFRMNVMDYVKGIGATMLSDLNGVGTLNMLLLWYVSATAGSYVAHRKTRKNRYSASNP